MYAGMYIFSVCNTTKNSYSGQTTFTTTSLTPLNTTLPIAPVMLHKTKQLTLTGKEYLCFHINRRSSHASQCVKTRIMNKSIHSILFIDLFEQQSAVNKCMLQSTRI